jgi:DNA-binding NtrC family response regulator
MKECPYCCERVQDKATKCKHYLEWIEVPGEAHTAIRDLREAVREWTRKALSEPPKGQLLDGLLNEVERTVLTEALQCVGHHRTRVADLLGLSRPTLYSKLERYGLP